MNAAIDMPQKMARLLDVTPEEYHMDPCAVPSLSASTANMIVSESPAHAWSHHPKFAASTDDDSLIAEDEDTKAKDNGTLIHRLLLGKGADLVTIEADNFRTKAAREQRDEAKAAGKLPVLASRLEELLGVVARLKDCCSSYGYEFTGQSEVAVEWLEDGERGPVVCRSMWDHVFVDDGQIYDVKTIRSANPRHIARYFVEHGYDIQHTAYTRALERLRPELAGRVELTFLFMEIEAPFAVVPVLPDGAFREIGQQRWARAVAIWERCLARNDWPAYCDSVITIEPPNWVVNEHLGKEWKV